MFAKNVILGPTEDVDSEMHILFADKILYAFPYK